MRCIGARSTGRSGSRIFAYLLIMSFALIMQPCAAVTLSTVSLERVANQPRQLALKSRADLSVLKDYDVILLVDKSHSMANLDCPEMGTDTTEATEPISRWQWCEEQLRDLTQRTNGLLSNGLRVVFFSDSMDVYDDVDTPGVKMLFDEKQPSGPTYFACPMRRQLEHHFDERAQGNVRPLLMAVISDGCANDSAYLYSAIAKATQRMERPDEVTITFIQIGNDGRAQKILNELDTGLVEHDKAKYDVVNVKKFADVTRVGLAQTLADCASAMRQSVQAYAR